MTANELIKELSSASSAVVVMHTAELVRPCLTFRTIRKEWAVDRLQHVVCISVESLAYTPDALDRLLPEMVIAVRVTPHYKAHEVIEAYCKATFATLMHIHGVERC